MAVLLRRNEREWENKEKKKQIQIQFFKDSVNSRYEINYHTTQPRYFVVCVCVIRARPRLMHTSSTNKTEVQRWVLHLSEFPQQSHYDTNFTKSVIKLKKAGCPSAEHYCICHSVLVIRTRPALISRKQNFWRVSRQSSALSDYNMLSSIPSKPNSILDKLFNEEGEIVVLLQLQWLLRQR